jgi:hypothetical protein
MKLLQTGRQTVHALGLLLAGAVSAAYFYQQRGVQGLG